MIQWINAQERTPKVDMWVLAIGRWHNPITYEPFIGYVDECGHWFSKDTGESLDVTLWAEIPYTPQEDE